MRKRGTERILEKKQRPVQKKGQKKRKVASSIIPGMIPGMIPGIIPGVIAGMIPGLHKACFRMLAPQVIRQTERTIRLTPNISLDRGICANRQGRK